MTGSQDKQKLKEHIIEIIVDCLSSGKSLPTEKELVGKLGVSRNGLRELLIGFEESGIFVTTQGKGRIVQLPDVSYSITGGWNILLRARPESLFELLNVRYVLERGFLPTVIDSLKLEDLQIMRDLVDRMLAKAKKNEIFTEEDQMFHRIMYSRTSNMVLDQLLKAFWDLFEQMSHLQRSENLLRGAELHKDLYHAILTKDCAEAERLLEVQFEDVSNRLKLILSEESKTELE
ncbi:MAG TPA: FCD domain-containing protein [Metabacillus sp.]|nr:FCD domain-containing protein [Metabacillus sp.]